jgi:hypothetical protein
MNNLCRRSKTLILCGVAALSLACGVAQGQTWSTGNFNTGDGWVQGDFITGQNGNDAPSAQWQGNDPEREVSPGVFVGGTDVLQFVTGYTPGGSGSGNSSIVQGGAYLVEGYLPGVTDIRLWRGFSPIATSPTQTVSFFVEWSLVGSFDVSYPDLDTFAFDLRDVTDSLSLLRLQLTPGINLAPNAYTLQTIAADAPTGTLLDVPYQAIMQIQADITGSSYDLSYTRLNSVTREVLASGTLVTGGSLATGFSAEDFGTVSIDWVLTSNDPAEPGSNYIIVNDVSVVPEPSTYALLVIAALGAVYWARRRRCW